MKKGNMIWILTVLFFMLVGIASCFKNDQREAIPPVVVDPCAGTAGPLFTAVKSLVNTKCIRCHSATIANGGMNFSVDCNIITSKTRIKVRAVDQGTMPPTGTLPAADKTTISNWINAGGRYSD